jgi:hypothetical protein
MTISRALLLATLGVAAALPAAPATARGCLDKIPGICVSDDLCPSDCCPVAAPLP